MESLKKWLSILVPVLLLINQLHAQNQRVTDSLEAAYLNGVDEDIELLVLDDLVYNLTDSAKKLKYSQILVDLATERDSLQYLYSGHLEMGNAYFHKGEMFDAVESFIKSAEFASREGNKRRLATSFSSIAMVYGEKEDYEKSKSYFNKSVSQFEDMEPLSQKDSGSLATALEGMGYMYVKMSEPDSALIFLEKSGAFFEALKNNHGLGYNLGNKGLAYVEKGLPLVAQSYLDKGVQILQDLNDYYGISALMEDMSEVYIDLKDYEKAAFYAERSLSIAKEKGLKAQISEANLRLSQIYEIMGDSLASYTHFKEHIIYRDSLMDMASVEQMADLRTDFEVSQKQLEVDLLNNQKRTQRIIMYSLGFVVLLIAIFYRRISKEKDRSDLLLLNILPSRTAKELKEKGKVKARKFEEVTVMFTDFEAFTRHSQDLSPEKLVKSVDYFFSAFDKIIEKYHLEKIKTIGDAYMCTGGLIRKGPLEPAKVIRAAFEIIDFVDRERESDNKDIAHFSIRIGINTGPVVGGVVGTKKFAYDIWGDTVNVAARMETNSMPSRINISENTYQLVKDQFECEYRGEIDVKNKGMMNMYFVHGPKSGINNHEVVIETGKKVSSAPHRP